MYLLDTNIILELLLYQRQADRVAQFLSQAPTAQIHISVNL
jgi:predicted nucleic acid-binding protein